MGISWGGTDRELTEEEINRLDPRTREAIRRRQREERDPLADFLGPDDRPERRDEGFGW